MILRTSSSIAVAALALCALTGSTVSAKAETLEKWWPFKVIDASSGTDVEANYVPLEKADKAYTLCVLFPHLKDSFWLAVDYGIAEESRRLGVNMNLHEAGGYENLTRQLSQFDDCLASHATAIIIGGVSEGGMGQKYIEAMDKGIPVISVAVPVTHTKIAGKVYADFETMGMVGGKYLLSYLAGKPAEVVTFPGPSGAGWPEGMNDGFKAAIAGSNVKMLGEKFGDTGVQVQMQLIQDALQAYPDMTVIWGSAPAAEAALGAVAQAGRQDVTIMSSYENQAMLDATKRGDILGFATQFAVANGTIAVDQAVRAIEKKPMMTFVKPIPEMVTNATMEKVNLTLTFAPADFKPVFTVKQ
jgi:periplasmic protein TorT